MAKYRRLVLFDCDGTLVDSQHSILAAMDAAFRAHGLPAPESAAVRHVVGLSLVEAIGRLAPEATAQELLVLAESYKAAFLDLRVAGRYADPLYPGARAALDVLAAAGVVLGIVTGKSRRGLVAALEAHGLVERFHTLHTADDGPGKPHPGMVRRALDANDVAAGSAVVVGDTVYDIQMARAAGVRSIGVAWGYHDPAALAAAGADSLVTTFDAVPATVQALLATGPGSSTRLAPGPDEER